MSAKSISKPLFCWSVCILLLFGIAFAMPQGGFWITDGGNKFMVLENLLRHGTIAMQNPASGLDPANRFFPDAVFHFQRIGQAVYSVFPPYFSIVSAPFYRAFGFPGLFLLPLFGAAAALALLWRWMQNCRIRAPWLLFAACFATPLVFYAVEFWEMTLGAVPVLVLFVLLQKRHDVRAGAALACGLWFRPEMFFFAAVTGVLLLCTEYRRAFRFGAGFLAAALPYGIIQTMLFGNPLGVHGATYVQTGRDILANYRFYLAPAIPPLGLLALISGAAPKFRSWHIAKMLFYGLCILLGAWQLWHLAGADEAVFNTGRMVDLFTTTPFVYAVAANWRPLWNVPDRKLRFVFRLTLLYTLMLPALLTSSDIGIIWGARHWIFLMPVLAVFAWYTARTGALKTAVLLLFLLSGGFQFCGLKLQYLMRGNSVRLAEFIKQNSEDVIVSDVFFLPMQTPQRFSDRRWLFVKDGRELLEAVRLLKAQHRPFTLVRSHHTRYMRYGNDAVRELLQIARITEPPQTLRLRGTDFLSIDVFRFETQRR